MLVSHIYAKRSDGGHDHEIRGELSRLSSSVAVMYSSPTLLVQAATSNFCGPLMQGRCVFCKMVNLLSKNRSLGLVSRGFGLPF